jgi:hypothetical protein
MFPIQGREKNILPHLKILFGLIRPAAGFALPLRGKPLCTNMFRHEYGYKFAGG